MVNSRNTRYVVNCWSHIKTKFFIDNNENYSQNSGLAMGSNLFVLAEIFMVNHEHISPFRLFLKFFSAFNMLMLKLKFRHFTFFPLNQENYDLKLNKIK